LIKNSLRPPRSFSLNPVKEPLTAGDNDFNRNDNHDPNSIYVPIMELDYYGSWYPGTIESIKV